MSLVESCPSTRHAIEGALRRRRRAAGRRSRRSSAASVWTKQSIVANAGEIIPAPLACAVSRTVPDGSATSTSTSLANLSVVRIASEKSPWPYSRSSGAQLGEALDHDRRRRAGRRSRRSRRPRPGPRRTPPTIAAAPCIRAASSKPRRPVAALALPELATITRSASSRVRSLVSTTGAASTPERVKRAALTQSGERADHQAEVEPARGLEPAGDARGAEARRQVARVVGDVLRASATQRTHSSPSVSGRPNIRLRFCTACDAAPFHRLSMTEKTMIRPVRGSANHEIRQ